MNDRLRILSEVQEGTIREDDSRICPPLTQEEKDWVGLGPTRLLAEVFAEEEP